jgi:hypothetical protein
MTDIGQAAKCAHLHRLDQCTQLAPGNDLIHCGVTQRPAPSWSHYDPFDLIEAHLVVPTIIELRRA